MKPEYAPKSRMSKTAAGVRVHGPFQAAQPSSAVAPGAHTPLYLYGAYRSLTPALQRLANSPTTSDQVFVTHHSPPATGRGSRDDPLTDRRSVQRVADMTTDAYYHSPVNPDNPVLVWTNGTQLFFAPAQAQIVSGRTTAAPEPSFAPPSGYVAEELHWDRRQGLTTGGGPLVVIARQAGQPDLEVAVSNTLAQRASFIALGSISGVSMEVAREGTEFMRVNDTSVPLPLSGATAEGPIHHVTFADGFLRYRAAGGDHDLYIARGADPAAYLVERSAGTITQHYAAGTIAAVIPEASGVVRLERTTTFLGLPVPTTLTIDLRTRPPTTSTAAGFASAEAGYVSAKTRLQALNISIEENGVRLRVAEMEAIESALTAGGNRGLNALLAFRTLEGLTASDPILEVIKMLGPSAAFGLTTRGGGTPLLSFKEPFERRPIEPVATLRHEMTHVIMGAIDAVNRAGLTAAGRADLEGALRYEAGRAREKARAGRIRMGEYGRGDVVPPAGTFAEWRGSVGQDVELASIWVELLGRYTFIPDPEGTAEFRGASLADESRYLGVAERTGHPADSVDEFTASFVTSATLFRSQFVRAVLEAETAGNARGGRGGTYLRSLYRRAWRLIDSKYVPLGSNPF